LLAPHLVVKEITSPNNHLLKQIRLLHDRHGREKAKLFLIEGAKVLNEAIEKKIEIVDIAVSETFVKNGLANLEQSKIKILYALPDKLFAGLGTTTTPTGIIAIARMREDSIDDCLKGANPLLMVCDAIQDPGNLGTIIRSGLAFGANGMILTKGSVDPYNPKVVRGAMGASFGLPIVIDLAVEDVIDALHKKNIRTIALDARAKKTISDIDLRQPTAFFFGNEGHGFSQQTMESVSETASIPMRTMTESLNVAISAAIVMFECARVRAGSK
jgi:RNA methyltransferase, TrmH family